MPPDGTSAAGGAGDGAAGAGKARVLVTGAGGRLGGYVMEALAGDCAPVGFDMKPPPGDAEHLKGDILSLPDLLTACEGVEAVVHIAAVPNIHSAPAEDILRVNVLGSWNLLEAAERCGVRRVVLCSSDSAVGNTVWPEHYWPPRYLPLDEDHPVRPSDPYGLSKHLAEEAGRSFAARGRLEVVALRPVFILYPEMLPEAVARQRDPAGYRGPAAGGPAPAGGGLCWHHVDPRDVAEGFRRALVYDYRGFERFFLSADSTLAPEPTLERIERAFGRLPEIREPALYRERPYAPMFDTRRARERLGLTVRHDHRARVLAGGEGTA